MNHVPPADPPSHWEGVYRTKASDSVSWFRPHLDTSLALLGQGGLSQASRVIDVGGGASTLVDDLLALGLRDVTVLDLSSRALAVARERLGTRGEGVQWRVGDILAVALPEAGFDLWHDRAVLHFLTGPDAAAGYAAQAARAVRPGGFAVIGGFAPDGPERCSGLVVARRSAEDIAALMGPAFRCVATRLEQHTTPGGSPQSFVWVLLERIADAAGKPSV